MSTINFKEETEYNNGFGGNCIVSDLKERFNEAFYKLLNAGDRLNKVSEKLENANNLIKLNKAKQNEIKEILNNLSQGN